MTIARDKRTRDAAEPALRVTAAWSDIAALKALVQTWPAATREELRPLFSKAAIRAARKAELEAALFRLAIGQFGSAVQIAERIFVALLRYQTSAWRYEKGSAPPTDPRRAKLHAVLTLCNDQLPAIRTIRRPLGKLAQKRAGNGQRCAVKNLGDKRPSRT